MAEAGPSTLSPNVPDYLRALSRAQLTAATHPSKGALCISAPPGSGKTRVLTSRVAWLVREQKIMPEEMVVVTFTNKAANEMKERLVKLIGGERASRLVLGTFHATCARFLRRYGQRIDLPNNFSIMDADDSRKVLKGLIAEMKPELEAMSLKVTPESAQSSISWSKAKDISPAAYRASVNVSSTAKSWRGDGDSSSTYKTVIATLYEQYQEKLRESNALDFDDLLVFGVKLLRKHPSIVSNIRHVLVDEMQDTNTTQYELMSLFANAQRCVTTVGDPDQSVYGWRAAEIGNLDRMAKEFQTEHVLLEENYRSTGRILEAALAVIEQDRDRVAKGLFTSHPAGPSVALMACRSPQAEASFIASEIKRLVAYSGGMLNYGDFAILLRFNALSREVEQALQTQSIPSRMVGGSKFFDRMEVKDILAYLTLCVNPDYAPAFVRVANVPKRGIGEKSLLSFVATARDEGLSAMELAERIADSKVKKPLYGLRPLVKTALTQLVNGVRELRKAASEGSQVDRLIQIILDNISYKSHLEKEQDCDSRMKNVEELMNFSKVVVESATSLSELRELNREAREESFELVTRVEHDRKSLEDKSDISRNRKVSTASEFNPYEVGNDIVAPTPPPRSSGQGATRSSILDALDAWDADEEVLETKPSEKILKRSRSSLGSSSQGHDRKDAIEIVDSSDESTRASPVAPKRGKITKEEIASSKTTPASSRSLQARKGKLTRASDDVPGDTPRENFDVPANSPLRTFLEACTLSSDALGSTSEGTETEDGPKVTISTCHAAKGLEYPVVFVVGVEDGIFPFIRCSKPHEIAEERRLLYVAMTRAQGLLYLTHCQQRMMRGEEQPNELSMFVRPVVEKGPDGYGYVPSQKNVKKVKFASRGPELDEATCAAIARILGRKVPSASEVQRRINEYESRRPGQHDHRSYHGFVGDERYGNGAGFGGRGGGGFHSFGGGFNTGGSFGMGRYSGIGGSSGNFGGEGRSYSASAYGPIRDTTSNAAGFSSALETFGTGSSGGGNRENKTGLARANSFHPPTRHLGLSRGGGGGGGGVYTTDRHATDESYMDLADPSQQRTKTVAPSPGWLEEYKSGVPLSSDGSVSNLTGGQGGAGSAQLGRFQSSHQASLDQLKSFLAAEDPNEVDPRLISARSEIGRTTTSHVPRPPAAFGKSAKVSGGGGSKSLGVRRAPSSSLRK